MTDREDEPYYLYAMAMPEGGPVKVGFSADPERRARDLQRQGHKAIFIFGLWPVGKQMAMAAERYAHWLLRHQHYRGEWFNATREEAGAAIQKAGQAVLDQWDMIPAIDVSSRKIANGEHIPVKHPSGTMEAIQAVLMDGESRTDFIRAAVQREIERRASG